MMTDEEEKKWSEGKRVFHIPYTSDWFANWPGRKVGGVWLEMHGDS